MMEEFYGMDQKKHLNKYDVMRKYTKNLKMRRRF